MQNQHIAAHIDNAIDALIGGNWDPALYTPAILLGAVRDYEDGMTDDMHPIVGIEDCAKFLNEQQ